MSRVIAVYSTSVAPGMTMPIEPFASVAAAIAAHAASIHARRSRGVAPSRCASTNAPNAIASVAASRPSIAST